MPDKGKNCFGNPERDRGQSRVPEPPHKITGIILLIVVGFNAFLWPYKIDLFYMADPAERIYLLMSENPWLPTKKACTSINQAFICK